MKKIPVFLLLILMSVAAWAQDMAFRNKDFPLIVRDKKGHPVNKIMVRSLGTGQSGKTQLGLFVFRDMSESDTISLMLPKFGQTLIPVAGLDSIVVTIRSKDLYSYVTSYGQIVYIEKERLEPGSLLNIPELLRQRPCNSLFELL